jgi:chromosome segregation ATPase
LEDKLAKVSDLENQISGLTSDLEFRSAELEARNKTVEEHNKAIEEYLATTSQLEQDLSEAKTAGEQHKQALDEAAAKHQDTSSLVSSILTLLSVS